MRFKSFFIIGATFRLFSGAVAAGRKKFDQAALGKLSGVWKTAPESVDLYAKTIIAKMDNKDPHLVCMAGAIVRLVAMLNVVYHCLFCGLTSTVITFLSSAPRHLTTKKDTERLKKLKADFIQLFVKNVLSSASRVPDHVNAWSKPILAHVTHEEFSGKVLAQVNRGLLRNPETCIDTVANLLKSE